MSGLSLSAVSLRSAGGNYPEHYLYLKGFDKDGNNSLDEKDHPLFKGAASPAQAEAIILAGRDQLAGEIQTACIRRDQPPEGFVPFRVIRVIDGDTYVIRLRGKVVSVRVESINTTEMGKGSALVTRQERAQPGAVNARGTLIRLFAAAGNRAYIDPNGRKDKYDRLISATHIKSGGRYENLSELLTAQGAGHAYYVTIEPGEEQQYSCSNFLMHFAQLNQRGIFQLSDFRDPANQAKVKPLHVTSFHPNARGENDEAEPLYNEYFRLVNLNPTQPLDLAGFTLFNKLADRRIPFPGFSLPPGRTVRVVTGAAKTNADPRQELVLSLGLAEELWTNPNRQGENGQGCLVIERKSDRATVDWWNAYSDYKRCP